MRSLKFRIWDKSKNEWLGASDDNSLKWYGFYLVGECMTVQAPPHWALDNGVVEQYTGIKDKNGKEIYEGDVVQRTIPKRENYYELYEVVYDNKSAAFKLRMWAKVPFSRRTTHLDVYFADVSLSVLEVSGNIHKNSGLLPYKVKE